MTDRKKKRFSVMFKHGLFLQGVLGSVVTLKWQAATFTVVIETRLFNIEYGYSFYLRSLLPSADIFLLQERQTQLIIRAKFQLSDAIEQPANRQKSIKIYIFSDQTSYSDDHSNFIISLRVKNNINFKWI